MTKKFLISGGGTGGHIFPAIAIANALKLKFPNADFLFVGANGKMEMEKVPQAGYKIIGLNITGLQRKLSLGNLLFPFRLLSSLLKARQIIKSFKPDVVIGVGGFASGPVLRMATWLKIPSLIQEQNSFAGITNKWVAKSVNKICVAYDNMDRFFPKQTIVKTGNPVRKDVVEIEGKREKALAHFGFSKDKPVLLVIGGSLGARSINLAMQQILTDLFDQGIQVLWQTGKNFEAEANKLNLALQHQPVVITTFIKEMDLAYAAADLVVSRAGAIAVSELCLVAKPTILVPFPHAAEDHQTKNALALVNTNAAIMIADNRVDTDLLNEIIRLKNNLELQITLKQNIVQHAFPNATDAIIKEVESLLNK